MPSVQKEFAKCTTISWLCVPGERIRNQMLVIYDSFISVGSCLIYIPNLFLMGIKNNLQNYMFLFPLTFCVLRVRVRLSSSFSDSGFKCSLFEKSLRTLLWFQIHPLLNSLWIDRYLGKVF